MSKRNVHKSMMSGTKHCAINTDYTGPLEKHHINGRKVRNAEGDWNIVYLSPDMHRMVHEGMIIIEGWFNTTSGRELIWHKKDEESITGQSSETYLIKRASTIRQK